MLTCTLLPLPSLSPEYPAQISNLSAATATVKRVSLWTFGDGRTVAQQSMRLAVRSRVNFDLHASLTQSKHSIASQVYYYKPQKLGPHNHIKKRVYLTLFKT